MNNAHKDLPGRAMLLAAAVAGLLWASPGFAAPPPPQTADIVVSPRPSVPGGVPADITGVTATYAFSIDDGDSLVVRIPVEICSSNYVGAIWVSFDFGPNAPAGDLASKVTLSPASGSSAFVSGTTDFRFARTDGAKCETLDINLDTGPLTLVDPAVAQTFTANVNSIGAKNPNPSTANEKPKVTATGPQNVHINVTVNPATAETAVACYMTDSEGDLLLDANGDPVTESASDDGVFAIVVNKKNTEVATNPGQFYYNFVYWNRGDSPVKVSVDMTDPAPTGVVSNGSNAVHSALFGDVFDPNFQSSFNCANDGTDCYGTPWGATGKTGNITVPPDMTLLVTYHLEWEHLRSKWSAGCSGDPLDCPISVTGGIQSEPDGTTIGECTAGAHGYGKQ